MQSLVCVPRQVQVYAKKEDIERIVSALGNVFNVVLVYRLPGGSLGYRLYVVDTDACIEISEMERREEPKK